MHRVNLSSSALAFETLKVFSCSFSNWTTKRFRVLTGWFVSSQVFEVDAFDDFHRETSCCGVVNQAHEDLRCGSLTD